MNAQNTAAAMQNARALSPAAQARAQQRQARMQEQALAQQAQETQMMFAEPRQRVPNNPMNYPGDALLQDAQREGQRAAAGANSLYGDVVGANPQLMVQSQPPQDSGTLMNSVQPEFLNEQAALAGAEATTNRGISQAPDGGASQGQFLGQSVDPASQANVLNQGLAATVAREPNSGRPVGPTLPVDYDQIGYVMDAARRRDLQANGIPSGVTGDQSWQPVMPPDSMGALAAAAQPLGMPLPVDAPPPVRGRRRR
jgi:hypothetical protein